VRLRERRADDDHSGLLRQRAKRLAGRFLLRERGEALEELLQRGRDERAEQAAWQLVDVLPRVRDLARNEDEGAGRRGSYLVPSS
jgi:hypothetical protein